MVPQTLHLHFVHHFVYFSAPFCARREHSTAARRKEAAKRNWIVGKRQNNKRTQYIDSTGVICLLNKDLHYGGSRLHKVKSAFDVVGTGSDQHNISDSQIHFAENNGSSSVLVHNPLVIIISLDFSDRLGETNKIAFFNLFFVSCKVGDSCMLELRAVSPTKSHHRLLVGLF